MNISIDKNINVKLIHVKSHQQQYTHNDIADEYAKKAVDTIHPSMFINHYEPIDNLFQYDNFSFCIDSRIIDSRVRSLIKYQAFEDTVKRWNDTSEINSFNKRMSKYYAYDKRSNVDFNTLLSKRKRISIIFKARLNYLPTNEYIHKRFGTREPICGLCQKKNENVIHLLLKCSKLKELRIELLQDVIEILHKKVQTISNSMIQCWFMDVTFNPYTREFKYVSVPSEQKKQVIAGILGSYTELTNTVLNHFQIQDKDKTFRKCQLRIFKYIEDCWKQRCQLLHSN